MKKIFTFLFLTSLFAIPILGQDIIIKSEGRILPIYWKCSNLVRINPNISYYKTSNGTISKRGKDLVVMPEKTGYCIILGKNKTTGEADTLRFSVTLPPAPNIVLASSTKNINLDLPQPLSKSFALVATPDKIFEMLVPKEAKYSVEEFQIMIFNNNSLTNNQTILGSRISNLSALGARRGSRVIINPKTIYRLGSDGEKYPVWFGKKSIIFNIK